MNYIKTLVYIFALAAYHLNAQQLFVINDPRQLKPGERAAAALLIPDNHFIHQEATVREGGYFPLSKIVYDSGNKRYFASSPKLSFPVPIGGREPQLAVVRQATELSPPNFRIESKLIGIYTPNTGYPKDTKNWSGIKPRLQINLTGDNALLYVIVFDYDSSGRMRIQEIGQARSTVNGTLTAFDKIDLSQTNDFLRVMILYDQWVVGYSAYSLKFETLEDENPVQKEARYTANAVQEVNSSRAHFDSAIVKSKALEAKRIQEQIAAQERVYSSILALAVSEARENARARGATINSAKAESDAVANLASGRSAYSGEFKIYRTNLTGLNNRLKDAQNSKEDLQTGRAIIENRERTLSTGKMEVTIPLVYEYNPK